MRIGIIGTSSLSRKAVVGEARRDIVATRYGDVPVEMAVLGDDEVVLVRRAGARHPLEPGRVNYRAAALALRDLGADYVVSTCVVGSLTPDLPPGALVSLSQFLDFTRHRPPTLFDEHGFGFTDMTEPYCPRIRGAIRLAAGEAGLELYEDRCYVGVDGPRYETAAEVRMFRGLGGDVVGHTGVTEAIMAREAGLCYACIVLVANYAAGITSGTVSNEEVAAVRQHYAERVELLVAETVRLLQREPAGACQCASSTGVPQLPNWAPAATAL